MKFLRNLVFKLVAVVLFFTVLLLASENSTEVALTFLEYSTPVWPISWWVLGAFLIGVIFASIINSWTNARLKLATRKVNTRIQKTNETLDKVKAEKTPDSGLPVEFNSSN